MCAVGSVTMLVVTIVVFVCWDCVMLPLLLLLLLLLPFYCREPPIVSHLVLHLRRMSVMCGVMSRMSKGGRRHPQPAAARTAPSAEHRLRAVGGVYARRMLGKYAGVVGIRTHGGGCGVCPVARRLCSPTARSSIVRLFRLPKWWLCTPQMPDSLVGDRGIIGFSDSQMSEMASVKRG